MDIDEINKMLREFMEAENNRGRDDFEGLSPVQMTHLLYHTFDKSSPIQFKPLTTNDLDSIPLLNVICEMIAYIQVNGPVKLTKTDALPTAMVRFIYEKGYIREKYLNIEKKKMIKEQDCYSIELAHILMDASRITRKYKGKWTLTKFGEKSILNKYALFTAILRVHTNKFNWGYGDFYGDMQIGRVGWGFTCILLLKYGKQARPVQFYAEKYIDAFPFFLEDLPDNKYISSEDLYTACYNLRTFERFLNLYGFVNIIESKNKLDLNYDVVATPLFFKWVKMKS